MARRLWLLMSCFLILWTTSCQSKDLTEMEEWDMVFISASNGWGVAEAYAEMIEERLGITVNVHDLAIGSLDSVDVLAGLQGEGLNMYISRLDETIPEAEIIVVFADPDGTGFESQALGTCFGGCDPNLPSGCPVEVEGTWREVLENIYEEILVLKDGEPVIVQALGLYNPLISHWEACGMAEQCNDCWTMINGVFRETAAAYNVPFADVWAGFNGGNYMEDPIEKGYILDDGEHCTESGAKAQAEVLFALGFEPIDLK